MIPGAPEQARWYRPEPRRALAASDLDRMVAAAFPHSRVIEIEPLAAGLRNTNLKLRLTSMPELIVLRIYEHDVSLCQKEIDLIRSVRGSVPVPDVIHAEPRGLDGLPPFAMTRYVEGINFRELKHSGDSDALAQAADSAGRILAAIGRINFSKPGWLAPGPTVTAPLLEGADPMPRFVDLCLASTNLQRRVPVDVRERTHDLVRSSPRQLASLESEARLVHGDFNKRNLLVRRMSGWWSVVSVLDWEFAVSGSPLCDIGNFLRYERTSRPLAEPHFSAGYQAAGGTLLPDWRRLARIVDLTAICERLTHDSLPDTVAAELVELLRATVEDRDPHCVGGAS